MKKTTTTITEYGDPVRSSRPTKITVIETEEPDAAESVIDTVWKRTDGLFRQAFGVMEHK
jgi:hypothetical protein